MIRKKLKALLLSAGLLASPFGIMAFDWVPVGECVKEVNGVNYAFELGEESLVCDAYNDGDRIIESGVETLRGHKTNERRKTKKQQKKKTEAKVSNGRKTRSFRQPFNTSFTATAGDNTLNIYGQLNQDGEFCPLKVDGDILLTADTVDMTVNIQTPATIMPYVDPTGDEFGLGGTNPGNGYAQIYFDAQAGRTITVNVQHNLEFIGRTLGNPPALSRGGEGEDPCSQLVPLDMILTFAGSGKTVFRLDDGTTVKFLGNIDTCNPVNVCDENSFTGISNNAGGTKVYVTMEQTQGDVTCFIDKLVFERSSLESNNACGNDSRVGIVVGHNSIITYVSDDPTGLVHEVDANLGNFASIGFDPSNNGTGRMVLFILGAYTFGFDTGIFTTADPGYLAINRKFPFNEGAVVVAGHHVASFSPSDIRTTLNYSEPAGGQAIMRVTDDQFYRNRPGGQYDPQDRRGLLVVNDCQSVTKSASDPYLDYFNTPEVLSRKLKNGVNKQKKTAKDIKKECCTFPNTNFNCFAQDEGGPEQTFGYEWSYSRGLDNESDDPHLRNVRNGFVIGINGALDINHNCFLDYVAGSVNQPDLLALNDYQNNQIRSDVLIKPKNPAALKLDGLDTTLYTEGLSAFEAGNPILRDRPIHARINLRGDGTLLLRASGSSKVGYIFNLWSSLIPLELRSTGNTKKGAVLRKPNGVFDTPLRGGEGGFEGECGTGNNPVDQPGLNFDDVLLVGDGVFDGYRLSAPIDANQPGIAERCCDGSWAVSLSGEGQHVLEVEGKATIWSFPNTTILDPDNECSPRDYATIVALGGKVIMPTIAVDYTGNEVDARPLTIGDTYARYNSPALFLNDNLHLVNTNLIHSDVTKMVNGNPAQSEPALVGGERLYFANRLFLFGEGANEAPELTDKDRFRFPELQLYSSTLHLFESLASTGMRWVVKDRPLLLADGLFTQADAFTPAVSGQAGNNTSVVRFYDHGDSNDTHFKGHGRILQQGSLHNTMADGHATNWATEGGYWNIFKHNEPSGNEEEDPSASVFLSLQNGDLFAVGNLRVDDPFHEERAHHLFLHSIMKEGGSNMAIGWPVIEADEARNRSINNNYPYFNTVYPKNYDAKEVFSTDSNDRFLVDAFLVPPSTVSIEGNYICWGGFDCDGKGVRTPLSRENNNGIVYVNHGGRITIDRPQDSNLLSHPYETVVDTIIAQKMRNDYNLVGDARVRQLSGIIDLPHDQSTFMTGAGIQTYGFTQEMFAERDAETAGFVRLSYDNPLRKKGDRSGAEEAGIDWFNREGNNNVFQPFPTRGPGSMFNDFAPKRKVTRATETLKIPVIRPDNILYIGTNDDIKQVKVAGATQSDPLIFEVSGDQELPVPGRVREFVTIPRTQDLPGQTHMVGEGDHAQLYLDFGGRAGLGNNHYNEHSNNAWTRLGRDHVQILPLGDGVVDVNSNLLVADRLAIVATTLFSQNSGTGSEEDPIVEHQHRLTFRADTPTEIRIPAGGELDLSTFGQAPSRQEIAFGGKVRLIFEPGSTLRFPSGDETFVRDINGELVLGSPNCPCPEGVGSGEGEGGAPIEAAPVVLYMNDEAEIVFEGQVEPQEFTQPFVLSSNANQERIKIVGKGQIWLNKNAKFVVNAGASVGIQTDAQTPQTDVVISLQRQAEFNIGNEVLAGGAFEVGNPVDQGSEHSINFTIQHTAIGNPRTHIDREGFLGIGAGVIDKHGKVNGNATRAGNPVIIGGVASLDGSGFPIFTPETDPNAGWTVQALHNLDSVRLNFLSGRFEHNRIADGSNSAASLFAVGPAQSWFVGLNGPRVMQVVGGGNMMKVPAGMINKKVNVWDYASVLPDGEQYSILPSAPLIFRRTDVSTYALYNDAAQGIADGVQFTFTTLDGFFNLMSFRPIGLQDIMLSTLGTGRFVFTAGFVNFNNNLNDIYPATTLKIERINNPILLPQGNIAVALNTGTLAANGLDKPRDPATFEIYLAA